MTDPPYLKSAVEAIDALQINKLLRLIETYPDFDINIRDMFQDTLLIHLCRNLNEDKQIEFRSCFEFLLQHGIDINAQNISGKSALMTILEFSTKYKREFNLISVNKLISLGTDLSQVDKNGDTVLNIVLKNKYTTLEHKYYMCTKFVSLGVDYSKKNLQDEDPLIVASDFEIIPLVRFFMCRQPNELIAKLQKNAIVAETQRNMAKEKQRRTTEDARFTAAKKACEKAVEQQKVAEQQLANANALIAQAELELIAKLQKKAIQEETDKNIAKQRLVVAAEDARFVLAENILMLYRVTIASVFNCLLNLLAYVKKFVAYAGIL